jgi:transcriptional regulator of arginine metabolism
MSQKNLRLKEIKDIITHRQIGKQEDLLNILHRRGFDITQATLSRDLSGLNVARKNPAEFGTIYFIPDEVSPASPEQDLLYGARSLTFSANLGVLKTLPGYANSVGALIDAKNIEGLLGTVAGNDTVLLILAEDCTSDDFLTRLGSHFSNVSLLI